MALPELGSKRVCVSCGAKFYDLCKDPAVCPKCGADQPAEVPRLRRSGDIPVPDQVSGKPKDSEADDADIDVDTDDDDADVLEDAPDLDDDEDDADISSDIDVPKESEDDS
ncbi:TIGR02300 family protein [Acetobacter sp. AN02]|uniref:TIGR02300 family protein n=1 Tax=Acetobacter sp. AN02 TaxID=2894186 RepID=UPI0024343DA1|nr:TIGR02300 family protein [Acetobacter sp. AN02]MDG6094873.1 TIGR02300 family protein [Acetobacter sp. AN02]